jgi:hypothetical protein
MPRSINGRHAGRRRGELLAASITTSSPTSTRSRAAKGRSFFTPVVGDEATTRAGHFNAFLPDRRAGARITASPTIPIAERHPLGDRPPVGRDPEPPATCTPASGRSIHRGSTGHRAPPGEALSDAIEVINSGALQSDPMQLVRDWMAVVNHGERVTAVGGSDSHDVARFIVGQGRTYLACRDDNPSRIDVAAACRALREGRASVSLGLLTTVTVDGRFHVGDLVTGSGPTVRITVTVLGPSWSSVDRVELFADRDQAREQRLLEKTPAPGDQSRGDPEIPSPRHDAGWWRSPCGRA